jgi:hypothetical protein
MRANQADFFEQPASFRPGEHRRSIAASGSKDLPNQAAVPPTPPSSLAPTAPIPAEETHNMGTGATRLRSGLSGSGEGEGGGGGKEKKGEVNEEQELPFPAIRRSLSNVLPPAVGPATGTERGGGLLYIQLPHDGFPHLKTDHRHHTITQQVPAAVAAVAAAAARSPSGGSAAAPTVDSPPRPAACGTT